MRCDTFEAMAAKNKLGYDYYTSQLGSGLKNGQKKWRNLLAFQTTFGRWKKSPLCFNMIQTESLPCYVSHRLLQSHRLNQFHRARMNFKPRVNGCGETFAARCSVATVA